jgi:hypothetical protein
MVVVESRTQSNLLTAYITAATQIMVVTVHINQ